MRRRVGWVQSPCPPPLLVCLFSGLLAQPSLCKRNCFEPQGNFVDPETQASFFTWCSGSCVASRTVYRLQYVFAAVTGPDSSALK